MMLKKIMMGAAALALSVTTLSGAANAGSIYLTGHDVLLHSNQNGYSTVILDWLRGAGTGSEITAGSYRVGLVLSDPAVGSASTTTLDDYGGLTTLGLGAGTTAGAFTAFLGAIDVLVVPSHTSCGGCAFTTAASDILNGFSAEVTSFFNAGGDIWGNSGATLASFYGFLPPSAVATGTSIGGSTGFAATAAGVAIGITDGSPSMINGFPTHNRFSSFDPDFTVFETRDILGTTEVISIGIRDATIGGGGIGTSDVPEPASMTLLGAGLAGIIGLVRRRRAAA